MPGTALIITVHDTVSIDAGLEVQVEVNEQTFSDEIKVLQSLTKKIQKDIKDLLGVTCKVRLVEPKSITRSEGKAKRVIDNRPKES